MNRVRCAIYTRKSSEEGLEQDFNSLHAQREACSAYVLSQASEGWSLVPDTYDDGGLSGGTLERPALQRLLADIAAAQIDIIVVYKVDRLTRSLLDFARLVEAFDKAGVSFVSITQSFNTTTSMGRLTLNMLLSFAQFEREVTAERIRDKIAASKAKGMWMGGTPPLGYRADGRSLAIVEDHAALIRNLFRRYLELGNVRLLAEQLEREDIKTPLRERTTDASKRFGGKVFSRGHLYRILSNPIYLGEIHHRGNVFRGRHLPIIDRDIWDKVQRMLADNTQGNGQQRACANTSLLAGRIIDGNGDPLLAVHATKGKVRYRYYVSRHLQHGRGAGDRPGLRLPAREIEAIVAGEIATLFGNPIELAARCRLGLAPQDLASVSSRCAAIADGLRQRSPAALFDLVGAVRVGDDRIETELRVASIAEAIGLAMATDSPTALCLTTSFRLTRSGRAVRLIQGDGRGARDEADPSILKLLAKARRWWLRLADGKLDATALAKEEGVTRSYLIRIVRLAFLSPPVTEAILDGRQHGEIDAAMVSATDAIPLEWNKQAQRFLPAR